MDYSQKIDDFPHWPLTEVCGSLLLDLWLGAALPTWIAYCLSVHQRDDLGGGEGRSHQGLIWRMTATTSSIHFVTVFASAGRWWLAGLISRLDATWLTATWARPPVDTILAHAGS
jgi:hypothetical protein